ncbi:MAG: hypothetical protein J6W52_03055 [Bacteroidaceae bacterium]|nr:hypothetical protein [Bacteroidaceae bacterium]
MKKKKLITLLYSIVGLGIVITITRHYVNYDEKEAKQLFFEARECYFNRNYSGALAFLDSIKHTFPKWNNKKTEDFYETILRDSFKHEKETTDSLLAIAKIKYDSLSLLVEKHNSKPSLTQEKQTTLEKSKKRYDSLKLRSDTLVRKLRTNVFKTIKPVRAR